MAIAVDASTPVRWSAVVSFPTPSTSASFTAPADALLVACVTADSSSTPGALTVTIADSGGLTWTKRVERTGAESVAGGIAAIFTARTTSAVARTVDQGYSSSSGTGTSRMSTKLYVLTGVDVDGTPVDTVGASNEGGNADDPLNTTNITPGANGLLIAANCDWNVGGVMTSSNLTIDSATYASAISVASGYRTSTSGVALGGNFNPPAGPPQNKWCQITVREVAAATKAPPVFHRSQRFMRRAG